MPEKLSIFIIYATIFVFKLNISEKYYKKTCLCFFLIRCVYTYQVFIGITKRIRGIVLVISQSHTCRHHWYLQVWLWEKDTEILLLIFISSYNRIPLRSELFNLTHFESAYTTIYSIKFTLLRVKNN